MNVYHREILKLIKKNSGKPTRHTFLNSYLGTGHPRYPMNNAAMRAIAKSVIRKNALDESDFLELMTSLIEGKSFTEKSIAGFLLDYAGKNLWKFEPVYFDRWLSYLEGWAEIDTLCTGKYSGTALVDQFTRWKKLLVQFSKSNSNAKRRASLVLCCVPLRKGRQDQILTTAFQNINRLQSEKDVLITKAISWVLRSAISYHRQEVKAFVDKHKNILPKIAVRETLTKLKTGKKTLAKRTAKK
jgi:3-methyladenine DNA glycosylase AlkD